MNEMKMFSQSATLY